MAELLLNFKKIVSMKINQLSIALFPVNIWIYIILKHDQGSVAECVLTVDIFILFQL